MDDVDWTTWALFQTSKDLTTADVDQAWEEVRQIGAELASFQEKYPLFLTPTTASTAPLLNDTAMLPEHIEAIKNMETLSKEEKLQLVYDQWLPGLTHTPFTQVANLTGTPAISLPTYVSTDGLPLGIQFMAAQNNDYLLLEVGKLFEENQQFNQIAQTPEIPEEPDDSSDEEIQSSSTIESSTSETNSSTESTTENETSTNSTTDSSSKEETSTSSTKKHTTESKTTSSTKQTNKPTAKEKNPPSKNLPRTGESENILPIAGVSIIVMVSGFVAWRKLKN
jgi:LPXTG-motif cell wall-anchored protein